MAARKPETAAYDAAWLASCGGPPAPVGTQRQSEAKYFDVAARSVDIRAARRLNEAVRQAWRPAQRRRCARPADDCPSRGRKRSDMVEVEVQHALGDIRSGLQNRDVVQAAICMWG